jgi:autotransporter-associated beta strand protein
LWLTALANNNAAYWTGAGGSSWSATNFSDTINGIATLSGGNLTSSSDVQFAATGAGNLTTTLGANYTIGTLTITTPEVTINGTNTLTVNSSTASAINISATGNTTIGAILAGSAGLTKSGSGTLTLGANNTYTGNTTFTGGTVVFKTNNAFGNSTTGAIIVNPGAGNTATLQSGAENLTISKNFTLTAGSAAFDTNSNNTTLSGVISGSGSLTKSGSGTLTLSGSNTYNGSTTISAGTLSVQGNYTFTSANQSIASGAVLDFNVASGTRDGATTTMTGSGTLRKSGAGTIQWGATSATFGFGSGALIDVQGGTFTGGSNSNEVWTNNLADLNVASGATFNGVEAAVRVNKITGSGTIQGGYSGGGSTTVGVDNGSSQFDGVLADAASGILQLTKNGTGTITLNGNNTYTGTTTINTGTLAIAASGRLGGGTYSGNISNNAAFIYSGTNNQTLSGIISGSGSLTKNSSSTLTLSGNNTFSGGLTLNNGTLTIGISSTASGGLVSSGATGSGNVTLNGGTSPLLRPV